MNCRKWALAVSLAASCAGCVTETKTVPISTENVSKVKGLKETEYAKRDAQPATWVSLGELYEAKAADTKLSPPEQSAARDEARKSYQKALEFDPKCVAANVRLANLYVKQGDAAKANAVYQRALQLNPKSPQLWYEHGMVCCQQKNFKAGLESLAKAHALEPESHLYATQYGMCLARVNQPDEAVKVMACVMNKADANYNVARMMLQIDQPELGQRYLQVALMDRPTHPDALRLQAALQSGGGQGAVAANAQFDPGIARISYEAPH
jgi:tetratricopeptide (TPR) repeat protein